MDRALLERHLGHIRDSVALLRERGRIDRLATDPVAVVAAGEPEPSGD
jgi:hypothetical protein